jgi:hypothetical protein
VTSTNDGNDERVSAILDRHRMEIEELRRLQEARRQLALAVNAARRPAPRLLRRTDDDCA